MVVLKRTILIDYFGAMDVRKIILVLLVVLSIGGCTAPPERNCAAYKTGSFSFTQTIDGEKKTTLFTRTSKYQIEQFENKIDTAFIRWINDCEYILTNSNPQNAAEKRPVHMKILTTTDSSYTFEFNIVGDSKKLKGLALKNN